MAIAIDNTTYGAVSGLAATISHQVIGNTNTALSVNFYNNASGDPVTSVTYNGVSMTRATYVENASAPFRAGSFQYVLLNPPQGTYNVVINAGSGFAGSAWIRSYTGVDQTAFNAGTQATTNTANGTSITTTLTVPAGAWGVSCVRQGTGATTLTGGTNSTIIPTMEANQGALDTNGPFPSSGSQSMTTNSSGSGQLQQGMFYFAEAPSNLANLKTLDGIAKANIKTIDGIAIANVKTYNGIA